MYEHLSVKELFLRKKETIEFRATPVSILEKDEFPCPLKSHVSTERICSLFRASISLFSGLDSRRLQRHNFAFKNH